MTYSNERRETGLSLLPDNCVKSEQGLKEMTRRILHPQPSSETEWFGMMRSSSPKQDGLWFPMKGQADDSDCWETAEGTPVRCPYGFVGDLLYVKEGLELAGGNRIQYQRDKLIIPNPPHEWKWKGNSLSMRFMPKWAARLWLKITDVQLNQLKDMDDHDAFAEGVSDMRVFRAVWIRLHGSWNPELWVWQICYRKVIR